ncbi:MAG: oxygen-independent coproporphyrinogen III oxidase [Flavobacteriales bacterium]
MSESLIKKYNVPGPRYTSYPTVPFWDMDGFSSEAWLHKLRKSFSKSNQNQGISLYVHLPFCESLCTFCGCHKRITKNHSVEEKYLEAVLKEWTLYKQLLGEKPIIQELHFGGGTPTFFKPENLRILIEGLKSGAKIPKHAKWSIEGHPNNTTKAHLEVLAEMGFRRISFGVQDYDPKVQKVINRIQPFEHVLRATEEARSTGFQSICHDLVYGLPFQTMKSMTLTIDSTLELQPDRIALYSYAHVPWIKGNGQRGFKDEDIPKDDEKRALYDYARARLLESGYKEIGIDHFSKPEDALYQAFEEGRMHRNFMGYSDSKTEVMIGLGASSISDSWDAFAQNEKSIEAYYALLDENKIPVVKGHILDEEDLEVRKHILNLMCHYSTKWDKHSILDWDLITSKLSELESDGLVQLSEQQIDIPKQGHAFIRNICMCLDMRLYRKSPHTQVFSQTI